MVVTRERVLELLAYDPATGVFRWKVDRGRVAKAGLIAGHFNTKGRRQITIDGRLYLAARLAWLVVHGKWPDGQIDHVDLDKENDAIANLRECTPSQNRANTRVKKTNALGVKGIRKTKAGRFQARIGCERKAICLGTFGTEQEAIVAYRRAAETYFGEFARYA